MSHQNVFSIIIAYYTELNLHICNYAQKQCIYRGKIANTRLTKTFVAILPSLKGCQLLPPCQRDIWTINNQTPTNRALTQNRVATPCLRSGRGFTISPLVQVEIFPPFIVEKPCFFTHFQAQEYRRWRWRKVRYILFATPLLPSLLPERSILLFAGASNTTLYVLCTFCEYSVYNLYNV